MKTTWDLVSEVSKVCHQKAEQDPYCAKNDAVYPTAFGRMTGVLTGLPDIPENRSFLEKWLEQNKQS